MREYHYCNERGFISAFRSGEEIAFQYVFKKFYTSLCIYCSRLVVDDSIASDIVQEAFVKLWTGRTNFESLLSVRSYLYTVVRNAGLNYLRDRKIHAGVLEAVSEEQIEKSAVDWMIQEEAERRLMESVAALTPECRRVMTLLMEGKSYKEVGEIMEISPNTVRNHRVRALKVLKLKLGKLYFWIFF